MSAAGDAGVRAELIDLERAGDELAFRPSTMRKALELKMAYCLRAEKAEAELAAARAEMEAARGDALEEAAKVADQHWDGMVVPEARGGSEVSAAIRALKTRILGGSHGE